MKHHFALLLLLTSLGACSQPPYTNLDNAGVKMLVAQGVPIYDVRRAEEWKQTGVVAKSRKLTFVDASGRLNPDFLPRFTAEVSKDQPVILICRSGNRTDKLARKLVAERYTRVYNVRDGIGGWISANNPVVRN